MIIYSMAVHVVNLHAVPISTITLLCMGRYFPMWEQGYCKGDVQYVTGPAKTGHVGTNYTTSLYRSYLSIAKVYFHSVTCIMMPMKCLQKAENCNAIA